MVRNDSSMGAVQAWVAQTLRLIQRDLGNDARGSLAEEIGMSSTWKDSIYRQREQLAQLLREPLSSLAEKCAPARGLSVPDPFLQQPGRHLDHG